MTDQAAIFTVLILALIFIGLWMFNAKQKRKFDEAQRQRRLQREHRKNKTPKT